MQASKQASVIKRMIRRIPAVQRLVGHLVDLNNRVGALERLSQDGDATTLSPIHEIDDFADLLDSRILQVRKDIELALAPLVHQLNDRMARVESSGQDLDDRFSQMQNGAKDIDSRILQVRDDISLALAPLLHKLNDRMASIESSRQDVDDRLSQVQSGAQALGTRIMRFETESQLLENACASRELQDRTLRLENIAEDLLDRIVKADLTAQKLASQVARVNDDGLRLDQCWSKMAAILVREEWRYLSPKDVAGMEFVRIGRTGDGGYVMLNDLADCRRGISIGVGKELSWDLEIANKGINLALYDHTIDNLVTQHEHIHFRRFGARATGASEPNKMSLPEMITAEGLNAEPHMLLKIDIEGDEWNILEGISAGLMTKFSQVLVEFHGMSDFSLHDKHLKRMYVLKALAATHQCVHLHANNWGVYRIVGGIPIPDVIEATFASRDRYSFRECVRQFPTPIDFPNNADRAEFMIIPELLGHPGAS